MFLFLSCTNTDCNSKYTLCFHNILTISTLFTICLKHLVVVAQKVLSAGSLAEQIHEKADL